MSEARFVKKSRGLNSVDLGSNDVRTPRTPEGGRRNNLTYFKAGLAGSILGDGQLAQSRADLVRDLAALKEKVAPLLRLLVVVGSGVLQG